MTANLLPWAAARRVRSSSIIQQAAKAVLHETLEPRRLFAGLSIQINFQPAGVPTPTGYLVDSGQPYGSRGNGQTYGWESGANLAPFDNTANMRDRDDSRSPDQRYDTFGFLQKAGTPYTWDMAVPNGQYFVSLIGGDAISYGAMSIGVEGQTMASGTTTSTAPFVEGSGIVTVSDGKLTLTNLAGATNNKLNEIRVVAVPSILDSLTQEAKASVDSVNTELAKGVSADAELRDLGRAAEASLALSYPDPVTAVTNAKRYIDAMFAHVHADGSLYWDQLDTNSDNNATDFALGGLANTLIQYGGRLGATYMARFTANTSSNPIYNALGFIDGQTTSVDYTNIYTMKCENQILYGELLNDATIQSKGHTNLNTFISNAKAEGQFHEFDSPTYSATTLNNLDALYNDTNNAAVKASTKGLLDVLSYDLSANYFNGQGGVLSGPHSRDYVFTQSTGSIDHFYVIEGLKTTASAGGTFTEGLATYLNLLEVGYHPDATITGVAASPTRVVQTRWGTAPGQDRYNYITPDYALGSTSAYYDKQDKQIVGTFARQAKISDVTLVYDGFDQPYGKAKYGDDTKPSHLQYSTATVQDKNVVLSMTDLHDQFSHDTTKKYGKRQYNTIASDIVFPSNADHIYLTHRSGSTVTITDITHSPAGTSIPIVLGDVLGVQVDNGIFAIRPQFADTIAGYNGGVATVCVKFDGDVVNGTTLHDARLVVYHYKAASPSDPGITVPTTTHARFAVAMAASTAVTTADAQAFLANVQNATFDVVQVTDTRWRTKFALAGAQVLNASQDVIDESIAYRQVNYVNITPPRFSIFNGTTIKDVASDVLDLIQPT